MEYRHNHIAELTDKINTVVKRLKKVEDEHTAISEKNLIKKLPNYLGKKKIIYKHFELVRECMEKFNKIVNILFESEQSFATRTDQNGRTVGLGIDDFYKILDIFKSSTFTENNDENLKLRIILLYLQAINGTTEDKLKKIIAHANISNSEEAIQTIKNLNKLLGDGFIRGSDSEMTTINEKKRKNRKINSGLICSRWTPILKDIIEDCIDDKLDKKKFPVLGQDHVAVNMTSQQVCTYFMLIIFRLSDYFFFWLKIINF